MWSDYLLNLGMDFLVGSMVFVRDGLHSSLEYVCIIHTHLFFISKSYTPPPLDHFQFLNTASTHTNPHDELQQTANSNRWKLVSPDQKPGVATDQVTSSGPPPCHPFFATPSPSPHPNMPSQVHNLNL